MRPQLPILASLANRVAETAKLLEAKQAANQKEEQAAQKEQNIGCKTTCMSRLDAWMRLTWPDAKMRSDIMQSIDMDRLTRLMELSRTNHAAAKIASRVDWAKAPKASDFVSYRLEHRRDNQTGQIRLYAILDDDVDAAAYAIYQTTTNNTSTTTKEPTE